MACFDIPSVCAERSGGDANVGRAASLPIELPVGRAILPHHPRRVTSLGDRLSWTLYMDADVDLLRLAPRESRVRRTLSVAVYVWTVGALGGLGGVHPGELCWVNTDFGLTREDRMDPAVTEAALRRPYPRIASCRHCRLPVLRDNDGRPIHASLSYVCRDRWGGIAPTTAEPAEE